jgi:hypothetical protein
MMSSPLVILGAIRMKAQRELSIQGTHARCALRTLLRTLFRTSAALLPRGVERLRSGI